MSTQTTSMPSQQTGHKYTFQLELKKLHITPSLPFQVKILWARNQNKIESVNPIKLQPPQNQVTLQQCFCNKSTVLFNPKLFQFRRKQSRLQVVLYANGSPKQGGQFVLNLCQILDPYNIKKKQQRVYKVITRPQKPRCELEFKLTAQYCQQMIRDQQRSIGSGVGSISSKNTTSMVQGNSGISAFQQKQYVQKKNLFLYQAPSKDNQSVASYNSYSQNMMRYNSGKKQREDSMRKNQQYGISSNTRRQTTGAIGTNEMFIKTTSVNVKSINGDYDTRSKGGYNRVTQPQYDNKTQNFDQNVNKQLQQEQSRRSKLQAEVSKLNIYMKQQTSKLTQYIQQNTKLKQQLNRLSSQQQNLKPALQKQTQQLRHQFQQQISRVRQQNDDLHNRAFQLNNENRQLSRRYQTLIQQKLKSDEQIRRLRTQKQKVQVRFDALNRNMEGIVVTKQMSVKQVDNLKDQLQHIKSLNANLRDSLQKQRRKTDELQYATNYQKSTLQQSSKKKQQRVYQLERQNTNIITQLRDREKQIQAKKQLIYRLQKTSNQYKDKIILSENEKNRMLEENSNLRFETQKLRRQTSSMRDNVMKVRDQKTAQYEQKNSQLESVNYQNQQKIKSLEYEIQQNKKNYSQLFGLNDTLKKDLEDKKNQIYRLQANVRGLKQMQGKFYQLDKSQTQKQRQILSAKQQNNKLMYKISQLQDQCRKMMIELEENKKKARSAPDVDVNQILRQSVQMQVQLKFKTDELLRLKGIQQRHEDLLYRLQMEERNKKQTEQEIDRLQKEVKQKNKLYLIEVQKGKLVFRQKSQMEKTIDDLKLQLKRCQQIIFNGDRQVKDMEGHINFLQGQNLEMKNRFNSMQIQMNAIRGKLGDVVRLEGTLRQLEKDYGEKTATINLLTNNLVNAQKRVHELQNMSRGKQAEVEQARRSAQSASQKLIQLQNNKANINNQLHRSVTQKKSLQLKCDTMMQQLHSLKKQFEQQKVRSTSVVSIRSSQDQVKIRQMQNQLQKKDKMISKLTKQKLQIEQENINLHVQVMKKLSEMQKSKDVSTQGQ